MSDQQTISLTDAHALCESALIRCNTSEENAHSTAKALVCAEADGQYGHGLSRIPSYAGQARSGKVNGHAKPVLLKTGSAAARIDAANGFAYPAIDMALAFVKETASETGIACAGITRSHHFGQAGLHAERLAEQGLVTLVFGNSPKAIAFWGASQPSMGTNPIAFACPMDDGPPLVIDMAMSQVARGKIVTARNNGDTIPEGWALDAEGQPTTDPEAALAGSMAPMGGAKGAALAMMVEILSVCLTGANFGFEASSVFEDNGEPPGLGQLIVGFNPHPLSAGLFKQRIKTLALAVANESGTRLPGQRRLIARQRAEQAGITVNTSLYQQIQQLAALDSA